MIDYFVDTILLYAGNTYYQHKKLAQLNCLSPPALNSKSKPLDYLESDYSHRCYLKEAIDLQFKHMFSILRKRNLKYNGEDGSQSIEALKARELKMTSVSCYIRRFIGG